MAKQCLCFDMDGTLIDSMDCWNNLKYKMCDRYVERTGEKISLTEDDEKAIDLMGLKQAIAYVNDTYGTKLDFFLDACKTLQNFYMNECEIKPFVRETLERLFKDGYKMCVITATPYAYTVEVLKRLDLLKYFKFVLTPTQYPKCKRSKRIFYGACRRFMCLPKNAVLFDDANYAHITANAAGLRLVGVYDEYRDDDLSGFVDLNFKDFSEVLEHYKEKGCF